MINLKFLKLCYSGPPESFGRTEADVYGKTLNPLEAASMLCLLEDAVDELTILK